MGLIGASTSNSFVSAEFIYSKIKREFRSFASVNLIDEMDFPMYTMEVLRRLGNSACKESEALTTLENGEAKLPDNFKQLHAAYRCKNYGISKRKNKIWQRDRILENDITCEVRSRDRKCLINCCDDKIISRITISEYVNEDLCTYEYGDLCLLNLTPNVRPLNEQNSHTMANFRGNDISINDGYIFTNFQDDAIYMQYYGYAFDENGLPMIPDNPETEKAIEWHIKHQILLNFWLVDDLANALNKWQKAEEEAKKWFAEAKHINRLPSFNTLVQQLRNNRGINKTAFFNQIDNRRY